MYRHGSLDLALYGDDVAVEPCLWVGEEHWMWLGRIR
jgi:hypothetical protein